MLVIPVKCRGILTNHSKISRITGEKTGFFMVFKVLMDKILHQRLSHQNIPWITLLYIIFPKGYRISEMNCIMASHAGVVMKPSISMYEEPLIDGSVQRMPDNSLNCPPYQYSIHTSASTFQVTSLLLSKSRTAGENAWVVSQIGSAKLAINA